MPASVKLDDISTQPNDHTSRFYVNYAHLNFMAFLRHILIIAFLLSGMEAWATHNRAGEITYVQIGELTIRAIITTYTKTSSIPADRDTLQLFWGDGTSTMVPRANGNGDPLPNDIKVNYYIAEHTYPGRASYTLSMTDPNRIGGITNVNPPNSDAVPFYLETTFTFLNTQFQGFNSSPVLLQPPLDYACIGKRYIHNPNAFDPDGDSLSYELIVPLQDSGVVVPNYIFPDQIGPGPNNQISLNPVTGDFVWNAPQVAGIYNIAIQIHEYRNGVRINSMIRDMQILTLQCENNPPVITSEDEYCVIAGEVLEFDLIIDDPDSTDQVVLTASGGPFVVSDKVTLTPGPEFMDVPFTATFRWETVCDEIAEQPYTVVFRAADNFFGGSDTTGLADLQTVRIKVIGPPPEDVVAQSSTETVKVRWQQPYSCDMTSDEYFRGFSVWRREGSNSFVPDSCETGLNGRGYTQIGFDVMDQDTEGYFFDDVDVETGKTYCYRILAEFAQLTPGGNAYNRVRSIPSEEVCIQLNRDNPLLTKVSIAETDTEDGIVEIEWVKPLTEALDTMKFGGPYRFVLERSGGIGTTNFIPVPGADFSSPTFKGLTDTVFTEQGLDTETDGHTYRVLFYTDNSTVVFDDSPPASSVFLSTEPTDRSVILSWVAETPWENVSFEIFRADDRAGPYVSVATTGDFEYKDTGLENGKQYCYFVRATGTYGIPLIKDPLINDSQIACEVPFDNVPACPPIIEVENICDEASDTTPEDAFKNTIKWRDDPVCNDNDIAEYKIYFTPNAAVEFELIATVAGTAMKSFVHQPDEGISGCYVMTNVDFAGNESEQSNIVCVENCPFYSLPNAFTPNGDGSNDMFVPFPYRFVERIEMQIFNRWGEMVFETTDPDINWDGTNLNGAELPDGVYHYVCKVFEDSDSAGSSGVQLLNGYIQLVRG